MGKKPCRAVFLDRDGTINRLVYYPDHGFVDSPFRASQLRLLPGAATAIRALSSKGFFLVLASNQPGFAKGNMTKKAFGEIDRRLDALLLKEGARLDAKYYCMHHPQAKVKSLRKRCGCRKPRPGMLFASAKMHGIDLRRSYMVGDGINDVKAGRAAGCRTVFIGSFKPELWKFFGGKERPSIVAKSLAAAVKKIR